MGLPYTVRNAGNDTTGPMKVLVDRLHALDVRQGHAQGVATVEVTTWSDGTCMVSVDGPKPDPAPSLWSRYEWSGSSGESPSEEEAARLFWERVLGMLRSEVEAQHLHVGWKREELAKRLARQDAAEALVRFAERLTDAATRPTDPPPPPPDDDAPPASAATTVMRPRPDRVQTALRAIARRFRAQEDLALAEQALAASTDGLDDDEQARLARATAGEGCAVCGVETPETVRDCGRHEPGEQR